MCLHNNSLVLFSLELSAIMGAFCGRNPRRDFPLFANFACALYTKIAWLRAIMLLLRLKLQEASINTQS